MATKWLNMVVSDHYLKKYSYNTIQTWCVHLLGECSELIRFWATLAKFCPSSGHKMTEYGGFRPLFEKVFTEYNSNLVCTLIGWVFRIDSLLGHVSQILALWWPQNDWIWWFPTVIWKSIHRIQFKLVVYTCWATLAKHWPSSGHKMTENGGFRPLSEKLPSCGIMITRSISNMVFTLVRGVFTNDAIFCRIGLI